MKQPDDSTACLAHTRSWIQKVVIGLDLCPFAAPVVRLDALVIRAISGDLQNCLTELAQECTRLDRQPELDTVLLVIHSGYEDFEEYLDLLNLAEQLLDDTDYAGIFQLASFHPRYQFEGSEADDVENYTNRSPYPILQLLRENSVTRALSGYADPDGIPARNMDRMRAQGLDGMLKLLEP